ncbi:MAG: nickel-dependent hydrogenase large subunit [Verrucomicrobia bacterium]|nr:nickel-dependent hydrogenase large subunit [Verrucomicrobiota bacterium]
MPVITAAIDPITRIEGHLKVEVKIDTVNGVQQVVDACSQGTLFRGFEKLLEGRDPRDATIITSRICGVCPTSHAMSAALALDSVRACCAIWCMGRATLNLPSCTSTCCRCLISFPPCPWRRGCQDGM